MSLLENLFDIGTYWEHDSKSANENEIKFKRDAWTTEYIPELYISSERVNRNVAHITKLVSHGNCYCSIIGEVKSGKSFLAYLLYEAYKESLIRYTKYNRVYVDYITPEDLQKYTFSRYMQRLAQIVLGKYYSSKEQIIVNLKKFVEDTNSLIVVIIDNFEGEMLERITTDTSKILKLLKSNFAWIETARLSDYEHLEINQDLKKNVRNYSFRLTNFTLEECIKFVNTRIRYGLEKKNVNMSHILDNNVIEKAWIYSNGNPWILLSLLADAFTYVETQGKAKITCEIIDEVYYLFSRENKINNDNDQFFIQQAINNFPNRERQVCEYLMYRDATAKEITTYLYGKLNSEEYRTKYMGTKSFIRRLRDKNIVIVKGKKGRSLLFGINPILIEKRRANI